ncbi:unnamed protein product [Oreochromis niloticus]|nr:unnamed protein product [Mustela putorius furo]
MDLTSGYYNVEVHEEDPKYTAFTSPFGLYEYNHMPQGLCNSPATFMRMMLGIFGDQNFLSVLCYLDDVLVFAPTEELALERLHMVFQSLQVHNLKLAPKKCHFLRQSVKFLGHIVNADGIQSDPDKIASITSLTEADLMEEGSSVPSQQKVHSFLGMVMFYQQFIENCSSIAKPLFRLTSGDKGPRGSWRKHRLVCTKLCEEDWTDECRAAFNELKQALLDRVLLAHPNFEEPFLLSVDASSSGLGAVLSQVPAGASTSRPIAFAKAEAVATGGVQEAFRWTVHSADKASSNDQPVVSQCTAVAQTGMLTSSEMGAVFQAHSDHESRVWPHALLLPQCSQTVLTPNQSGSEPFSHDDLVGHQRRDDVLCRVISYVERGQRPSRRERANEPVDTKRLLKAWDKLTVRDGVLYRVSRNPVTKTKTYLYVVLPILQPAVLKGVHDEAGHQGQQRTLYLARQRFYWPVFDKNDESHTFKLMDDSTGQVKVVHRNLIMPVNFLPLSGASVQDDGDELSESGSLMVGCDREAVCNSSVGTAEYRTRAWVSDLPSAVSSDSLMTEVTQPEGSIVDQELACTSVPPVNTERTLNILTCLCLWSQ